MLNMRWDEWEVQSGSDKTEGAEQKKRTKISFRTDGFPQNGGNVYGKRRAYIGRMGRIIVRNQWASSGNQNPFATE